MNPSRVVEVRVAEVSWTRENEICDVSIVDLLSLCILTADERNAWIARLMGKGGQAPLTDRAEAEQPVSGT